ncbi:MAG: metal ABC transporter substrate-binding protein, partial [Anaerococcus obesiensis]
MKKKILAIILVFGIFVTGCAKNNEKSNTNSNNSNQTSQSENKDKETIYASFYPIYNLTKQIAGDKFNVKSFTNLNTEVHDFEPSAKDMADLSKAKVLFLNGAGLESWQEKISESSKVEIVDTSKGINLIENTHEDEKEDKDNHEDNEKDEDSEKEEHEHEDGEEHHHHGAYDPHVWLSPKNGIIQAKNIAEKLSEIDPENKDYYEKNFEKIKKELEEIDKEYEKKLENKENKKFLVDHEAFSYLARDYGLIQVPLTSITSTSETDAKT